jgi:hypothetical protein
MTNKELATIDTICCARTIIDSCFVAATCDEPTTGPPDVVNTGLSFSPTGDLQARTYGALVTSGGAA